MAVDTTAESFIEGLIEAVRAIRNARAEHKVEAGRWIAAGDGRTGAGGGRAGWRDFVRRKSRSAPTPSTVAVPATIGGNQSSMTPKTTSALPAASESAA
jgi:hypothetical protein